MKIGLLVAMAEEITPFLEKSGEPLDVIEDYDTTVRVWKTIKNYIKQMGRLRKLFKKEGIL